MKTTTYDFAEVKTRMVEEDWIVYSPADWVYHPATDTGFDIFVRTPSTALLNVYLDGKLITEYHQDFEVIDENTGIFLIVLFESLMRSLPAGDHTITLHLTGVGQITRTIHID